MPILDALDEAVHQGDIGTELVVAVTDEDGEVVDISGATTLTIYLTRPNGTTLTKTAVLDDDGTDGLMRYDTVAGDLIAAGTWRIQGYVAGVGGWSGSTREATFTVRASRHG